MKKETFKQAEETFRENVDNSMKWFQETTSSMVDAYSKQFDLGWNIYKKFIDTAFNAERNDFNKPLELFQKNAELFQKNVERISDLTKKTIETTMYAFGGRDGKQPFSAGLSDEVVKIIMETFNKQTKLTADFNKQYFEVVSEQFKGSKIDFDVFSEKLQKILQNNIELSEESIKTILDGYTIQAETSLEANEKLLGEINKLVDFLTESTGDFWTELSDAFMASEKESVKEKQGDGDQWKPSPKTGKKVVADKLN